LVVETRFTSLIHLQCPSALKAPTSESSRSKKLPNSTRSVLCEISHGVSTTNTRQGPPVNRIHSDTHPAPKVPRHPAYTASSRESRFRSSCKENVAPLSKATLAAVSRSDAPLSYQPVVPPNNQEIHVPQPRRILKPDLLQVSNAEDSRRPIKIVFSESLVAEPPRSVLRPSRSRPPSPYRAKRRHNPSATLDLDDYDRSQASSGVLRARFDQTSARYPQGHKTPSRPHTKSHSAPRITPEPATVKELESHRKETIAAVSDLNSRVGALENTVAAALPIVAEARLLWMENTVIRAQTKLGTTRQALCQYCELYFNATRLTSTKCALFILGSGRQESQIHGIHGQYPRPSSSRRTYLARP
jgi:hypothetical protein